MNHDLVDFGGKKNPSSRGIVEPSFSTSSLHMLTFTNYGEEKCEPNEKDFIYTVIYIYIYI